MNDNDIINVFEHCNSTTCDYRCPRWDDVPTKTLNRTLCRRRLCREMIGVANRQKAEIERLMIVKKEYQELYDELKVENEKLVDSIKEANEYLAEGDFAKGIALIIRLVKEITNN